MKIRSEGTRTLCSALTSRQVLINHNEWRDCSERCRLVYQSQKSTCTRINSPWNGAAILLPGSCLQIDDSTVSFLFMNDVTRILSAIDRGDPKSAGELLPLVYDELRRL